MTGEDYARHVSDAERIVKNSQDMGRLRGHIREAVRANAIAVAQVHATLAVAAALEELLQHVRSPIYGDRS